MFDKSQFIQCQNSSSWKTYTHKFLKYNFVIWTGGGATEVYNSKPNICNLDLEEYIAVLCTIEDPNCFHVYKRPSDISKSLIIYDGFFNTQDIGYIPIDMVKKFYEDLCSLLNEISISIFYCNECGIKLYQKQNLCWACEKGI